MSVGAQLIDSRTLVWWRQHNGIVRVLFAGDDPGDNCRAIRRLAIPPTTAIPAYRWRERANADTLYLFHPYWIGIKRARRTGATNASLLTALKLCVEAMEKGETATIYDKALDAAQLAIAGAEGH